MPLIEVAWRLETCHSSSSYDRCRIKMLQSGKKCLRVLEYTSFLLAILDCLHNKWCLFGEWYFTCMDVIVVRVLGSNDYAGELDVLSC